MNHFFRFDTGANGLLGPAAEKLPTRGQQSFGGLFNSAQWQEVLFSTYGLKTQTVSRQNGNGTQAQIQFCEIADVRGRRIVSLPFSDFCDPLMESSEDWRALSSEILERNCPIKFKTVHNVLPRSDERFLTSIHEMWSGTDLTLSQDLLWAQLDDMARRNIRKAEKSGVHIRVGRELSDIRAFHELHVQVRKTKYKLLAQPQRFFDNIHGVFSRADEVFVLFAEMEGVPIAGILFLQHGDTLYYKFNASRELQFRPNDLLVWNGILLGKQLGLRLLDFGISALDQPGLIAFKRKFATMEREVVQSVWTPPQWDHAQGDATGKLLADMTRLMTRPDVPDAVGAAASDAFYHLFC